MWIFHCVDVHFKCRQPKNNNNNKKFIVQFLFILNDVKINDKFIQSHGKNFPIIPFNRKCIMKKRRRKLKMKMKREKLQNKKKYFTMFSYKKRILWIDFESLNMLLFIFFLILLLSLSFHSRFFSSLTLCWVMLSWRLDEMYFWIMEKLFAHIQFSFSTSKSFSLSLNFLFFFILHTTLKIESICNNEQRTILFVNIYKERGKRKIRVFFTHHLTYIHVM